MWSDLHVAGDSIVDVLRYGNNARLSLRYVSARHTTASFPQTTSIWTLPDAEVLIEDCSSRLILPCPIYVSAEEPYADCGNPE